MWYIETMMENFMLPNKREDKKDFEFLNAALRLKKDFPELMDIEAGELLLTAASRIYAQNEIPVSIFLKMGRGVYRGMKRLRELKKRDLEKEQDE